MEPLFLTHKLRVVNLQSLYKLYDFQLRDHLLTTDDIYLARCKCYHKHRKQFCPLVTDAYCGKCKVANEKYINYRSLLFHPDVDENHLARCCAHVHEPPCGRCLGCKTTQNCIVQLSFECDYTTEATCQSTTRHVQHFTNPLAHGQLVCEHIYNTRTPIFYFCNRHAHAHRHEHEKYDRLQCCIQTQKCCENSTLVTEFDSSFIVTVLTKKSNSYKEQSHVIYDPSLWREQSMNHFISFLRAVINIPGLVSERYRRFEMCQFKVANIKQYKSGKQSIVRTAVTGFETKGVYQTATISCMLDRRTVLIPQNLYVLLEKDYDLTLVVVKRDPSINQTCAFVCKAERNPDPDVDTIVIPSDIAKCLHQDQDGDKNCVYALRKRTQNNHDRCESFLQRLARLELAYAYATDKTLVATPRFSFSENNLLVIHRKKDELTERSEFFRRTYGKGLE